MLLLLGQAEDFREVTQICFYTGTVFDKQFVIEFMEFQII